MTEKAQNPDFRAENRRFAQIFAFSPGNSSIWRAQKTADFRRKPKIFAENRRKLQIGLRHLRCVTFSLAPANGGWNTDLPFLAFLDFLAFSFTRNFLAFFSVFPFFPRDLRGSA